MLKLATAWRAPWWIANTNTIRELIPAISSAPASQPTRATARPFSPARTWVARPLATPSVRPTVPSAATSSEVVAGGRDRVHVHLRDVNEDGQRNDDAATVELSLAGLTQDDQDEHCVDEVIGNCHGRHDLLPNPSCRRPKG